MITLPWVSKEPFDRIRTSGIGDAQLTLLADLCRLNALTAVKKAGSGHLGSSFSAMDIVVHLYFREMNTFHLGWDHLDRDIYFSSKGHDVPGLYAVLYALGLLPIEKLLRLRKFGGLDGHPDIGIPGVEANSGSLGMGISKGRGMAWAKRKLGRRGRVFVMTGDGEWQEGQIYEALRSAVMQSTGNLIVIMDHNKVQSDRPLGEVGDLGDLENITRGFGWHVARCDGHDHAALSRVFSSWRAVKDRPKLLIADTVKGKGVSFMEHPFALQEGGGYYRWHAGAPPDDVYRKACVEIVTRTRKMFVAMGLGELTLEEETEETSAKSISLLAEPISAGSASQPTVKVTDEYVAQAFGETLVELASHHEALVVLDADLAADCRVRPFELAYPDRFIECGIAEQDMVSMAGGLARQGLLPVVNSFASFLSSRANEQIYNNASEQTKIIYAFHYAGLIPAGPGKSHQSIRDISLLGALPNCIILQPANAEETRQAVRFAVEEAQQNVVLRLVIGPSPRHIMSPPGYSLQFGRGTVLCGGRDALLLTYGPVMLHEALVAAEMLARSGIGLQVVNLPWLNRFDEDWLADMIRPFRWMLVLEDHAAIGGLGDRLLQTFNTSNSLQQRMMRTAGVEGYPACGTPPEVLRFHRMDGRSLADRISDMLRAL